MNFFGILHDDRAQHRAAFGLGVRFQNNNPRISRAFSVKKPNFFGKATMILFGFHDGRAQHRATFGSGVRFQKKKIQGLAGD